MRKNGPDPVKGAVVDRLIRENPGLSADRIALLYRDATGDVVNRRYVGGRRMRIVGRLRAYRPNSDVGAALADPDPADAARDFSDLAEVPDDPDAADCAARLAVVRDARRAADLAARETLSESYYLRYAMDRSAESQGRLTRRGRLTA